ncbi:hypothetical protein BLOT_013954, partial [Blomia tropicalis]
SSLKIQVYYLRFDVHDSNDVVDQWVMFDRSIFLFFHWWFSFVCGKSTIVCHRSIDSVDDNDIPFALGGIDHQWYIEINWNQ